MAGGSRCSPGEGTSPQTSAAPRDSLLCLTWSPGAGSLFDAFSAIFQQMRDAFKNSNSPLRLPFFRHFEK